MIEPTISDAIVEYLGVQFGKEGIASVDHEQKLLFIPKNDIKQIVIRKGFQAERPIIQLGCGFAVLVWSLSFLPHLLSWFQVGGTAHDFEFLTLILIPVGIWLIRDGGRKGLYLEIILDGDKRKIPFQKRPKLNTLREFIQQASTFGYIIDTSILVKNVND